jgi:hypothetical protein
MGVQFAVPRADDFSIGAVGVTFRESNGIRTLKGGGNYHCAGNSGYYDRTGGSRFYPVIEIKNIDGQIVHIINSAAQRIPIHPSGQEWSFSISENKPYDFLRYNSLSVKVKFVSGAGQRKARYPDGSVCNVNCSDPNTNFNRLLSSNVRSSPLVKLVNVQEETRIANIEKERLAVIEKARLADVEQKRLANIEIARLTKLQNDMLLLGEVRKGKINVGETRLIELLNIEKNQVSTVLPAVVGASSLIPLGILGILLINSSRGKK